MDDTNVYRSRKKYIRKVMFAFFMLILFVNLVNAMPFVDIGVKPVFYSGEVINFSYSFVSQQDEFIRYTASVNCEGSPEALLEIQEINLKENELFVGKYIYGAVDEDVGRGNCFASIFILEPYETEFTKPFEINTLFDFDFTLLFCKDSLCTEKSKVFVLGEEVYLDYSSDIANPSIEARLIFPNDKSESITLPATIKAEQIGTYDLEVTVFKEGYKTIVLSEQFGVIEKGANVSYKALNENKQTIFPKKDLTYYLIGGSIFLVLLVVVILLAIRKKRRKVDSKYVNS